MFLAALTKPLNRKRVSRFIFTASRIRVTRRHRRTKYFVDKQMRRELFDYHYIVLCFTMILQKKTMNLMLHVTQVWICFCDRISRKFASNSVSSNSSSVTRKRSSLESIHYLYFTYFVLKKLTDISLFAIISYQLNLALFFLIRLQLEIRLRVTTLQPYLI